MPFDFEKFPVYIASLKFTEEINCFLDNIAEKNKRNLIDQFQRTAMSITLNIAEGAGRYHKADKRNFYIIARGSVYECVACLQILQSKNLVEKEKYDYFYTSLNELAKQLSAMVK